MAKQNETGYVKNIGSLKKLIEFVKTLGTGYSPPNVLIIITALETLLQEGHLSLSNLSEAIADYKLKVKSNQALFKLLNKLATGILSTAKASNCKKGDIENIESLVKQIRGIRLTKLPLPNTPEAEKVISSAHTSMGNKLKLMKNLIDYITLLPEYQSDKPSLTVAGATTFRHSCISSFDDLRTAFELVRSRRRERNIIFDKESIGIVYIADQVKAYIEAKYDADSQEYKDVRKIHFRKHEML